MTETGSSCFGVGVEVAADLLICGGELRDDICFTQAANIDVTTKMIGIVTLSLTARCIGRSDERLNVVRHTHARGCD